MNIMIYIFAASIGLALSFVAILGAAFGGPSKMYIAIGVLVVTYSATLIFAFKIRAAQDVILNALALASPPIILFMFLWLYTIVTT